jgi:uncharacterized protein
LTSSRLAVRVTPRSAKPGVGGWRDGADGRRELEVRVAAAPADGAANAELIRLLAARLGIARSSVAVERGASSRHKIVTIDLDQAEAIARLAR